MAELTSPVTDRFTVDSPGNPNNPDDAFEGSNEEFPVSDKDFLIVNPNFTPDTFRLIRLRFTVRNVKKVIVTVIRKPRTGNFVRNTERVSCFHIHVSVLGLKSLI